ncbi:hypothetical protein LCGC14_2737440 [marine sediment metagenome]|uniref:Uncharacterized protein n=1 Tax=marine sediment metagenome TaxID=412755 RepID=A0A0F9BEF4_9ZZZZ
MTADPKRGCPAHGQLNCMYCNWADGRLLFDLKSAWNVVKERASKVYGPFDRNFTEILSYVGHHCGRKTEFGGYDPDKDCEICERIAVLQRQEREAVNS